VLKICSEILHSENGIQTQTIQLINFQLYLKFLFVEVGGPVIHPESERLLLLLLLLKLKQKRSKEKLDK